MKELQATGAEGLKRVLTDLLSSKETEPCYIIYRVGGSLDDLQAQIRFAIEDGSPKVWYNDADGKSAPKHVKDTIAEVLWNASPEKAAGKIEADWRANQFSDHYFEYYETVKQQRLATLLNREIPTFTSSNPEQVRHQLEQKIQENAWQHSGIEKEQTFTIPSEDADKSPQIGRRLFGMFSSKESIKPEEESAKNQLGKDEKDTKTFNK